MDEKSLRIEKFYVSQISKECDGELIHKKYHQLSDHFGLSVEINYTYNNELNDTGLAEISLTTYRKSISNLKDFHYEDETNKLLLEEQNN